MNFFTIFATLCFFASLQHTEGHKPVMCERLQQFMNQYCSADQQTNSQQIRVVDGRRGKAGPQGPPGVVNYSHVDQNIQERYEEFELKMKNNTERTLELYNKQLEDRLTELEIRFTGELEVKMEQKINRNLQLYNEQVEKEKEQSKRIDDLEKKITELEEWKKTTTAQTTTTTAPATATTAPTTENTLTSCVNATMDEASSWHGTGGIFNIYPETFPDGIKVYCDLTSDGGGWTVFQRRMDGSVDFYRGWDDYVNGFGEKDKEFWLGLETIYQLTKNGNYELRVDMGDWEGNTAYAQYGTFSIAGSDDNYRLTVGDYSGNAGDSLRGRQNGRQFSTKDRDNDENSDNCAVSFTGAWWYESCHASNLNGVYHVGGTGADAKNIAWYYWRNTLNYSYKFTEMKFRKKQN